HWCSCYFLSSNEWITFRRGIARLPPGSADGSRRTPLFVYLFASQQEPGFVHHVIHVESEVNEKIFERSRSAEVSECNHRAIRRDAHITPPAKRGASLNGQTMPHFHRHDRESVLQRLLFEQFERWDANDA